MTDTASVRYRDDTGMGLPELLTAMVLLAILMTIVVSAFTSFTSSFTKDRAATDSTNVASLGMNEVTRVIRSGTENAVKNVPLNQTVFQLAENSEVTLFAYLDTNAASPQPVKVNFSIDRRTSELTETRWPAVSLGDGYFTFSETAESSRVVARKIVPPADGGETLFRFYQADGTELVVPARGFSEDGLRQIAAVRVAMTVQADPTDRAEPVTITNRVGIPNLGISRVGL